jgi:hypothetical protein
MTRNWQLVQLQDLYRTAARERRITPAMKRQILELETALRAQC